MISVALLEMECYLVPMYIDIVPNRRSRPAVLLREGWREGPKVRKGDLYVRHIGIYEGEFQSNPARIDLDKLCVKYGAYEQF